MPNKRIPLSLTIASVVPFVALSVAISMRLFENVAPVVDILLTYAAIIISFLGGIHWGVAIKHHENKIANLLIIEGVIQALVAWGVLFYPQVHMRLLAMTLLYAIMWAIDSLLYSRNIIPQWFFNLRCVVTPIVLVSLYVAYFGLV